MIFEVLDVNCDDFLSRGEPPTVILRRSRPERSSMYQAGFVVEGSWLVATGPIVPGQPVDWALNSGNQNVRLPLVPYLVPALTSRVPGMAVQLGVTAALSLSQRPEKALLALGNMYQHQQPETGQECFQFWLGLAFRVRD